jgi:hypothetical protein
MIRASLPGRARSCGHDRAVRVGEVVADRHRVQRRDTRRQLHESVVSEWHPHQLGEQAAVVGADRDPVDGKRLSGRLTAEQRQILTTAVARAAREVIGNDDDVADTHARHRGPDVDDLTDCLVADRERLLGAWQERSERI